MSSCRRILVAVLGGAALSLPVVAPGAAAPEPDGLGGCYRGGVLIGDRIAGTGSAGQGVRRQGEVWDCASPVLPGIVSGTFRAELPWRGFGTPTTGTFAWSDGSVSTVAGLPNTLWSITDGPGRGHTVRFDLDMEMNGDWYYTDNAMAIESLTVVR
ncbi:hypothetical protein [Nocardia sp. NPDC050406]|uniref:hypothetical protein n=1 Tax=Nocardia sp. NPDC050406 TaxID=3364318 RepID=UPI003794B8DD